MNSPDDNLAALDTEYGSLLRKYSDLTARADELAAVRRDALKRTRGVATHSAAPPPPPPGAAALALLGPDLAELLTTNGADASRVDDENGSLARIAAEEAAVTEALKLLAAPLRRARIRAGIAAWEIEKPGFTRAVTEYCQAVLALDRATDGLSDARDRLSRSGAPAPFNLPHPADIRLPRAVLHLIEDATSAGIYEPRKAPSRVA